MPLLIWLGVWQLQRLEWKEGLVERMEERLDAPAVDIEGQLLTPADEYRRYRVTGQFVSRSEFHWLITSDEFGVGYQVFAPFQLTDGRRVIVNRGYIPVALKDPATRIVPSALETFEAIVRIPEIPGALDAENDVVANIWFTRDIAAMIALTGDENYIPLYLERDGEVPADVWPKPGAAQAKLVNNHLDYALTWFGLAIVLVAIYLAFHKGQGRIGYARNSGDLS